MKVLITGAEGFTGYHMVEAIARAGLTPLPCSVDLRTSEPIAHFIAQSLPDAVIHLAGISALNHSHIDEYYSVNVVGTHHLLTALTAHPPRAVLLASSAHIYGISQATILTEETKPNPQSHYAISKYAMELMAENFRNQFPITIVRPFNYTGPHQTENFVVPKVVAHFGRHASEIELGNLETLREYNDVRFVVAAYLRLITTRTPHHLYNICTGLTYSVRTILDTLEEIVGYCIKTKVNPAFIRANDMPKLSGDPSRLRTDLGSLPTFTLRETLISMIECYKEKNKISAESLNISQERGSERSHGR